jgi:hypothetical protein
LDGNEKKLTWTALDATGTVKDFPRLSLDSLMDLTLGVYQLKQAKTYAIEHIDPDGAYEVKVAIQEKAIIRARIQSRHVNAVQYDVWLKYCSNEILGWYCTCKVGARVVGCCAHISSLMWYLAYARYNSNELQQRSSLYSNDILDAGEERSNIISPSTSAESFWIRYSYCSQIVLSRYLSAVFEPLLIDLRSSQHKYINTLFHLKINTI